MKITVVYDNTAFDDRLAADWGFSCLIEAGDRKILFDTGAKGPIMLDNMKILNIDPVSIDEVFISHCHWDHTGGLSDFLDQNPVKVYMPKTCQDNFHAGEIIKIKEPREIHENIFSTGELQGIEQTLVLNIEKGSVIIVGCSHPGVELILKTAGQFGDPIAVIGGLHDFNQFELIENLQFICPTHCTRHIPEIESLYPEKYVRGGAGKVINL